MAEIRIDSVAYPLVESPDTAGWRVVSQSEVLEEIWDDLAQMGETRRETRRGYFFGKGWDPTRKGALGLSPYYHAHNNIALSQGYGYFMEALGPAGTLAFESASGASKDTASSLTFSHTVGTNNDRLLLVDVSISGPSTSVTSVTYNGVPLAKLASNSQGSTFSCSLWFLVGPATGANDVVVTTSVGRHIVANARDFYDVDPDSPFGSVVQAAGTSTAPTATVVTAAGEIVADIVVAGAVSRTFTEGADQTEDFDDSQGTISSGGSRQAGADGGVMSQTISGASVAWTMLAVPIKPVANEPFMFISDGDKIFKYQYDPDAGLTEVVALSGTADSATASTLVDAAPAWADDAYNNNLIKITGGTGSGQRRRIVDTTDAGDVIDIAPDWDITPDATSTYEIYGSVYVANGVAGRPVYANGKWYAPMGSTPNVQRLDTITATIDTWTAAGFTADHMATFQKGPTPSFVKSLANVITICTDTGNLTTWGDTFSVGDSSTNITDLAEALGEVLVAKEDNLYQADREGTSKPVLRFRGRGRADADNGKGMLAFVNIIFYPSEDGLGRYIMGQAAKPVGIDTIATFRDVPGITSPKGRRHAYIVNAGRYFYLQFNSETETALIQGRFRDREDPPGGEMIWNSVLDTPLSKGELVDSRMRLWQKGASIAEADRDIRVIELDAHGGSDRSNRRGQADVTHEIHFDETDFGRPNDTKQLALFFVEVSNWPSYAPLTLTVYYDDDSSATVIPPSISASGLTEHPLGTSDTGRRFRPMLSLTTTASYLPLTSDPIVLRVTARALTPTVYEAVIDASPEALTGSTYDAKGALKALRKLVAGGKEDVGEPGVNTTFEGDVVSVQERLIPREDGQEAYQISVYVRRWAVAA